MESEMQAAADRRLEEVLAATGVSDPRPACREVLREIRRRDEGQYAEAVEEYGDRVLCSIVEGGADPVQTWIEFGVRLAERLAPGKTVTVDREGRAHEYVSPPAGGDLLLRLPDAGAARAIPVALPADPTLAQRATLELLVHGRVKLAEIPADETLTKEPG